jgi:hypothetical protein
MPRGGTTAPVKKSRWSFLIALKGTRLALVTFKLQRVSADIRVIAVSLRDSESGITRYKWGEVAGVTTRDNGRQSCLIISCALIGTVPLFN